MIAKRLDELIEHTLYEAPEDEPAAETEKPEDKPPKQDMKLTAKEPPKDKDKKRKLDKDDIKDKEDEPEDAEVAVSIKLNDNVESGGKIKLIDYQKLTSLTSIESILKLFDIDPEEAPPGFKDKMEITINSPLSDFKEEEYNITLMDKIGQIAIRRPDFKTTITKKSTGQMGNLGQAVQQSVGEPGTAGNVGAEVPEPEEQVDLSYLPALDFEFSRAVKNEFFDRILDRR